VVQGCKTSEAEANDGICNFISPIKANLPRAMSFLSPLPDTRQLSSGSGMSSQERARQVIPMNNNQDENTVLTTTPTKSILKKTVPFTSPSASIVAGLLMMRNDEPECNPRALRAISVNSALSNVSQPASKSKRELPSVDVSSDGDSDTENSPFVANCTPEKSEYRVKQRPGTRPQRKRRKPSRLNQNTAPETQATEELSSSEAEEPLSGRRVCVEYTSGFFEGHIVKINGSKALVVFDVGDTDEIDLPFDDCVTLLPAKGLSVPPTQKTNATSLSHVQPPRTGSPNRILQTRRKSPKNSESEPASNFPQSEAEIACAAVALMLEITTPKPKLPPKTRSHLSFRVKSAAAVRPFPANVSVVVKYTF